MAALATRAYIAQSGDYYLCPLPATQVGAEQMQRLLRPVFEQQQELVKVYRQTPDQRPGQEREVIAEGYEVAVEMEGALDDQPILWQERRLIVRSLAWSEGQQRALDKRINQAQAEIAALNLRRQGKKVVTDEAELRACGEKILATNRVSGLLTLDCRTSHHQRRRRRYRQRPAAVNVERRVRIEATVDHQAVETAKARLGWRVYASNQGATELSLEQAVVAYREEYLVERGFGRLKGKELSLTPLYLETDERVTGLLRVLVIALRVLCLVEFSLRRELQATGEKLAGIYPGNPKRATQRPTTEMMLRVFEGLTLTMIEHGGQVQRHLTPLSPVQERILHLLGLSPEIYLRLAHHASKLQSSKLLLKMSEP
jgi:transposase